METGVNVCDSTVRNWLNEMRFALIISKLPLTQTEENGVKVGSKETIMSCGQLDESDIQRKKIFKSALVRVMIPVLWSDTVQMEHINLSA